MKSRFNIRLNLIIIHFYLKIKNLSRLIRNIFFIYIVQWFTIYIEALASIFFLRILKKHQKYKNVI